MTNSDLTETVIIELISHRKRAHPLSHVNLVRMQTDILLSYAHMWDLAVNSTMHHEELSVLTERYRPIAPEPSDCSDEDILDLSFVRWLLRKERCGGPNGM